MHEQVVELIEEFRFSQHLGVKLVSAETDRAVVRLPYGEHLGIDRVGGGAISALVDVTASCAFWSNDAIARVAHRSRLIRGRCGETRPSIRHKNALLE